MRKILFAILGSVFILPHFCKSYFAIEAKIDKTYNSIIIGNTGSNIHKSDSISIGYEDCSGTIRITTIAERKTVKIEIYKEGGLIYEDKDDVMNSSSLDYTLTEEEKGEYDVCVTTEDGTTIGGTIVKE